MTEPRQRIMEAIGKDGCYYLSLVRAAELIVDHRIDAIEVYQLVTARKGPDGKPWMDKNCYLNHADLVLGYLTGSRWTLLHKDLSYSPKVTSVVILRYERKAGMTTFAHFVLGNPKLRMIYDPYEPSQTVSGGKLVSLRVFDLA